MTGSAQLNAPLVFSQPLERRHETRSTCPLYPLRRSAVTLVVVVLYTPLVRLHQRSRDLLRTKNPQKGRCQDDEKRMKRDRKEETRSSKAARDSQNGGGSWRSRQGGRICSKNSWRLVYARLGWSCYGERRRTPTSWTAASCHARMSNETLPSSRYLNASLYGGSVPVARSIPPPRTAFPFLSLAPSVSC